MKKNGTMSEGDHQPYTKITLQIPIDNFNLAIRLRITGHRVLKTNFFEPKEFLPKLTKEYSSFVTSDCARIVMELVNIVKEELSYYLNREIVNETYKISTLGEYIHHN